MYALLGGGRYLAVGRLLLPSTLHCRLHSSWVVCPPSWAVSLHLAFTRSACIHTAFIETFRSHLIRAIDRRSNPPYFGIVSVYLRHLQFVFVQRESKRRGSIERPLLFHKAALQVVSVISRIQFSEVASLSDSSDCAPGDESTWHSWHRGTNQSTTPRTYYTS